MGAVGSVSTVPADRPVKCLAVNLVKAAETPPLRSCGRPGPASATPAVRLVASLAEAAGPPLPRLPG